MRENHPVLSSLFKLHADLGGQIKANRDQAAKFALDTQHVEAVIKMYAPDFHLGRIVAKRRNKSNPWFKKGTVFRCVLDALRESERPLTVSEIVEAMLDAKGVRERPRKAVLGLEGGVRAGLGNYEGKAVVSVGEGSPRRWTLRN